MTLNSASESTRINWPRALLALACLLAFGVSTISAQTCWRGQPFPACQRSWITEAGPRLGTDEPYDPVGYAIAIGLIGNDRPGAMSWGGAAEITTATESGTYLVTLMPRARWWLNPNWAVDAGLGVALLGPGDSPVGFKGGTAMAALNYKDLVLLTFGVSHETTQGELPGEGNSHTSVSLGLRFGAWLGPPVALASLAFGAAAAGGD